MLQGVPTASTSRGADSPLMPPWVLMVPLGVDRPICTMGATDYAYTTYHVRCFLYLKITSYTYKNRKINWRTSRPHWTST